MTLTDPTRENASEVPPEQQLDSDGANGSDSAEQESSGVGAGVLAAGIVGIGIIALIVGFVVKRRRSTSKEELS